jgi:predicted molibdopterin-dependent oxidoreductase YjgC
VVPYGEATQPLVHVPADDPGALAPLDLVLAFARTMYDDGVLMRNGLSLHSPGSGGAVHIHPDDIRRLGLTAGQNATVRTASGTASLPVVVDDTLLHGVVYVPVQPAGSAFARRRRRGRSHRWVSRTPNAERPKRSLAVGGSLPRRGRVRCVLIFDHRLDPDVVAFESLGPHVP